MTVTDEWRARAREGPVCGWEHDDHAVCCSFLETNFVYLWKSKNSKQARLVPAAWLMYSSHLEGVDETFKYFISVSGPAQASTGQATRTTVIQKLLLEL